MSQEWKLVPVVPTEEMLNVLHDRVLISVNTRKQEANILNDKAWWAAVVSAAPVPPAGGEVEGMPERLKSSDDRVPNMNELQKVAWCSGYGRAIDACAPVVTRLQAEIAQLTETTFGQEQVIETLEARAAQKDDLLTDVYLIAKQLAARLLEVSPDDEPAKDAIAALRQKAQRITVLPQ